jgi:hypothetical protein
MDVYIVMSAQKGGWLRTYEGVFSTFDKAMNHAKIQIKCDPEPLAVSVWQVWVDDLVAKTTRVFCHGDPESTRL